MNSAPSPKYQKTISLYILSSENKSYTVKFFQAFEKLEITIKNDYLLSYSYKVSLQIEDLHKLNKYFRQFDSIEEILEDLNDIEKLDEKIDITSEDKFVKLIITIPSFGKKKKANIEIMIPNVEVKENDLIVSLCEKVEKIDVLEKKINYLLYTTGKTEKDFELYEKLKNIVIKNIKDINSKIITQEDFITVSFGIEKTMNKTIKKARLLYRASSDGDNSMIFHSKCDGIQNTVTFVKSENGRKFGGFANQSFNTSNNWINDLNSFVFSLDFRECYYEKKNRKILLGNSSYGPIWGNGYDLSLYSGCLSNTSSTTEQCSFDYRGRNYSLSGVEEFKVKDYETYELILE